MHAFRCNSCGHLESAGQAGEHIHPHACSCCGAGVSYNPKTGTKIFDATNWEVLCEATPERLAELGLDGEVERHEVTTVGVNGGKEINVQTGNFLGLTQST
jgi:hypothetical protein